MRALVVLVASLLLVACPGSRRGEDESQNAPPQTSTTTSNPQAVPERSATMNPITPTSKEFPTQRVNAVATRLIQVQLTEYEIRLPDTLPAGHQTFHIANAGKLNHNFAIEGNGIAEKLASNLAGGDTADLGVELKPGTYVVYCPVDKHRGRGMERTVAVR